MVSKLIKAKDLTIINKVKDLVSKDSKIKIKDGISKDLNNKDSTQAREYNTNLYRPAIANLFSTVLEINTISTT